MIEWMLTLMSSLVVLVLLAPLAVFLGVLMLFGLVGHVLSPGSMVSPVQRGPCSIEV